MQMPRPLADTIAFWRDLPRHPREVLLVRGHHLWHGAAATAALQLPWMITGTTLPGWLRPVLAVFFLNFLLDFVGWVLHVKWSNRETWESVECPICDAEDEDDTENAAATAKA
ncbi:hypothetical protein ACFWIB_14640 [Streptomyces sp. NPDC127051]|uniref:hypothetical protein n=1 Tax=Streptomyces sp. NPDC127051 TaxID=3347119 RepID=UPI003656B2F9